MIKSNEAAIQEYRQKQIHSLLRERERFGDFKSQFKNLKAFRESLRPFYRWKLLDKFVGYRCKTIPSGDFIDHHVTAYFAPFAFKRKSWGGGQNSPVSHIVELSQALQRFQTRLLYVSLPLKLSVYPELVAEIPTSLKGASTLPQFRQMTLELLQNGVEVVDIFPIFMQHKKDSTTHLFAKGHNISSEGAGLIAKTLADYIQATTEFSPDDAQFRASGTTIYKNEKLYISRQSDSPFCIFGNCNLQAFHNKGAGIASNLAFFLNKEVDYLGRKLIFLSKKFKSMTFDEQTFKECCKRDIAICISFLSGSFVRTSAVHGITKKKAIWKVLRGKKIAEREWSTLDLESQ